MLTIIQRALLFILLSINSVLYAAPIETIKAIEKQYHGRAGISVINTGNHQNFEYRANERFPMCSTYKWLVAANILAEIQNQPLLADQIVHYNATDLIGYTPITSQSIDGGMSLQALGQAAVLSDNTAANLLINVLGGTAKVTAFARSAGDTQFRLDRLEPDVNTAIPNDLRDTTTPLAMSQLLDTIVFGSVLKPVYRQQLQQWMIDNNTGDHRIRAVVPKGLTVGDKTGTCAYGSTNDVGFIVLKDGSPILISVFFTQLDQDTEPNDAALQAIARVGLCAVSVGC